MNPETLIERLCAEAMQRLKYSINRSAGQHIRAMRKQAALRLQQKAEKENHE